MGPARFAAVFCAFVVVAVAAACSAGDASGTCDRSQCAAGNTCIAPAGAPAQCARPCATHTDCPFNYHCDANVGGSAPYCVLNTKTFPQRSGQFGAPCVPTGGFQNNPACDVADGFWCNAKSPYDGAAYCTLFGCALDTDCGAGFYCGRENKYPNASSAQLQDGTTIAVCLPRHYCAPCTSDVDCGPANGAPQHCVAGTDKATFCVPECHSNAECALDATCVPQSNYSACTPRAGVCKGDGALCSPCRSDADCAGGYCVPAYNSPEHFCTTKSGIACSYSSTAKIIDQCPTSAPGATGVGCSTVSVQPNMPADQCLGEVQQGLDDNGKPAYVEGCWTAH
jgi:hypothetical protein